MNAAEDGFAEWLAAKLKTPLECSMHWHIAVWHVAGNSFRAGFELMASARLGTMRPVPFSVVGESGDCASESLKLRNLGIDLRLKAREVIDAIVSHADDCSVRRFGRWCLDQVFLEVVGHGRECGIRHDTRYRTPENRDSASYGPTEDLPVHLKA